MANAVQGKRGIVQNTIYTGHQGRMVSTLASYSTVLWRLPARICDIVSLVLVTFLTSSKQIRSGSFSADRFSSSFTATIRIVLILPAALGPGVYLISNRNDYQKKKKMFQESKAWPVA
jgi:hypothetical protein